MDLIPPVGDPIDLGQGPDRVGSLYLSRHRLDGTRQDRTGQGGSGRDAIAERPRQP